MERPELKDMTRRELEDRVRALEYRWVKLKIDIDGAISAIPCMFSASDAAVAMRSVLDTMDDLEKGENQ